MDERQALHTRPSAGLVSPCSRIRCIAAQDAARRSAPPPSRAGEPAKPATNGLTSPSPFVLPYPAGIATTRFAGDPSDPPATTSTPPASEQLMKPHLSPVAASFAIVALGLGAAACGSDFSGTYKGEATETGTLKVAHMEAPAVATNESPPRKLPDQSVVVSKSGDEYTVKFNACEMKGKSSGTSSILVSNDCEVKIANWSGKMKLAATVNFDEQGGASMSVTGTEKKNNETVASYDYTFKGKK